jgi:formylglycine-generating enzyme required for sulfatase activity
MDLAGWSGRDDDPRWRFVLDEIELAVRRGVDLAPPAPVAATAPPRAAVETAPAAPALARARTSPQPRHLEDIFAEPHIRAGVRSKPRPQIPAAAIAAGLAVFAIAGVSAGALFFSRMAPLAAVSTAEKPEGGVVAFVAPKDQPTDDEGPTAEETDALANTIDADTSNAGLPGAAAQEPIIADAEAQPEPLRDSAPLAPLAPPAADPTAENPSAPRVKPATIATLAETAGAEPAQEEAPAASEATTGEPDRIAELAWQSTSSAAESVSFGSYFRDCVDCPDMAEIRKDGARAYALGVREVTSGQWRACVAGGACPAIPSGADERPVAGVSYVDAQSFVAWLSNKTGAAYRLPSEREWDAASEGAQGAGDAPNANGLYGMTDARLEWTEECWVADGVAAAADGPCGARVLKGASRDGAPSGERRRGAGFRVARDLN